MRKFIVAGIALLGLTAATSSQAAPANYNWNGFYVGGNLGYSWGPWDSTGSGVSPTGSHKANVDGWIGGVQGGLNRKLNQNWLVGVEGDFNWSREKHDFTWVFPVTIGDVRSGFSIAESWKLQWLGTIRGRVGMTPTQAQDLLIYGTGGLAVGKASFGVTLSLGTLSASLTDEKTKWGWTIGGGAEKALNKNWSTKIEYLYVDLGSYKFVQSIDTKLRDHILRVGVNYKFN